MLWNPARCSSEVVEAAVWGGIAIRREGQDVVILRHVVRPLELEIQRARQSQGRAGDFDDHFPFANVSPHRRLFLPVPPLLRLLQDGAFRVIRTTIQHIVVALPPRRAGAVCIDEKHHPMIVCVG